MAPIVKLRRIVATGREAGRRHHPDDQARDVAAIVVAGGRSAGHNRSPDRSLLTLSGRSLLSRTLEPLLRLPSLAELLVLSDDPDQDRLRLMLAKELPYVAVRIVGAGSSIPAASLHKAMLQLEDHVSRGDIRLLLVHDTAWPLASLHLAHAVVEAARRYGAAAPCLSRAPEIWLDSYGTAMQVPLDRNEVVLQMPQAFSASELLHHYAMERGVGYETGSPAEIYGRRSGRRVRAVAGEPSNLRVTSPQDLFAAETVLARSRLSRS